jgi:hypothetical protein
MRHPIHRWLTDLEHTACGQRRPHGPRRPLVVRGWQDVTCKRCLSSIHWKLAQLQRQRPESPGAPQGTPAVAMLTCARGPQSAGPSSRGGPPMGARTVALWAIALSHELPSGTLPREGEWPHPSR